MTNASWLLLALLIIVNGSTLAALALYLRFVVKAIQRTPDEEAEYQEKLAEATRSRHLARGSRARASTVVRVRKGGE